MTDSDDPTTLYHYTDAAGLLGIVKPSFSSWEDDNTNLEAQLTKAAQLRASDVRYMNDSQELRFGARFFVPRLGEAAHDAWLPQDTQRICGQLAAFFSRADVFDWDLKCFAACFCDDGDLCSQWRGYAGGAGGFAIGFNRNALEERSYALPPNSMRNSGRAELKAVRYGAAEAQIAADEFIAELRDERGLIGPMIHGAPGNLGLQVLASYALRSIVSVKDDGFHEEHEWRLIFVDGEPRNDVKIRFGRHGVLPHVPIAVNMRKPNEDENTLPPTIDRLVVGPGHNQRSQVAAVRELLKARGHSPDVVVPSRLSFTG